MRRRISGLRMSCSTQVCDPSYGSSSCSTSSSPSRMPTRRYANVRKARRRCIEPPSCTMSGSSRWISATIEPMGSSTSGSQTSGSGALTPRRIRLPAQRSPGELRRDSDEEHAEEPLERPLVEPYREVRAADHARDGREPDRDGRTPVDVAVAALAPDSGSDGRNDREQRGGLRLDLREPEREQRRDEEDTAADSEHPSEHARPQAEHDREQGGGDAHPTISLIAMPTRRAANASESVR